MKGSFLLLCMFVISNTTTKEILCTSSGHFCKSTTRDPKPCHNAKLRPRGPCNNSSPFRKKFCDYCPDMYTSATSLPYNKSSFIEGETPCRPEDGFYNCQVGGKYGNKSDNCVRRRWVKMVEACRNNIESISITFQCTDDELKCPTSKQCVHRTDVNSPFNCMFASSRLELVCHDDEFQCAKSHRCIPRRWVKDGSVDCSSGIPDPKNDTNTMFEDESDEKQAFESCVEEKEYRCKETKRCIPREWVIDGKGDCKGGDDEERAFDKCNNTTEFRCGNGRCVARYRVNDGFPDCVDKSDENTTDFKCRPEEFDCNATIKNRCIPRSWVGNSIVNCPNSNLDETSSFEKCRADEFACGGRCLPTKYRCDGIQNCADCSDEMDCGNSKRLYMRCSPGNQSSTCIPLANRFDGTQDCDNGVDEEIQDGFGFICHKVDRLVKVAQSRLVRASAFAFCTRNEDNCTDSPSNCVKCLTDDDLIGRHQVCDGKINCRDMSDECPCEQVNGRLKHICRSVLKGEIAFDQICNGSSRIWDEVCMKPKKAEAIKEDKPRNYTCHKIPNIIHTLAKTGGIRAQHILRQLRVENATECDGELECLLFDDECDKECDLKYKSLNFSLSKRERLKYTCETFKLTNVSVGLLTVAGRTCPLQSNRFHAMVPAWLCDGVVNCDGGEDESDKTCDQEKIFKCNAGTANTVFSQERRRVSIPKKKCCDGNVDCLDTSDERGCDDDLHFYCETEKDGTPFFVHPRQVEDGKQDCDDNSDECPKDKALSKNNIFSSKKEMLMYLPFRVMIWVMAIASLVFNLFVIVITVQKLRKKREKNSVDYCNRLFIINLASSDFLMGVSLLILGLKIVQYSGEYCHHDVDWRSSNLCQAVGVITFISFQTSLFTLTSLTAMRLHLALRPFSYLNHRYLFTRLMIVISWISALLLALTPVVADSKFLTRAVIKPNPFFKSTLVHVQDIRTKSRIEEQIKELKNYTADKMDPLLTPFMENRRVNVTTKRSGFYTATSVCFPNFFYSKYFPFKAYSVAIICINLFLLLFIIISYAVIYKKSMAPVTRDKGLTLKSKGTLRRRIALVVATNTVSWLPVCVMALLSFYKVKMEPIVNVVAAVLLLPINCSFNPIIYSRLHYRIRNIFVSRHSTAPRRWHPLSDVSDSD